MGGATRFLMLLTGAPTPPFLHHRCPALLRLSRRRTLVPASFSCLPYPCYHFSASISPLNPRPSKIKASHQLHTQTASIRFTDSSSFINNYCPEWSNFINNLSAAGYFNEQRFDLDDEIVAGFNLPEDFVAAASACLAFARERPDLLGLLSRRDIEVVVEKGMPSLFKNGDESARKMRSFLDNGHTNMQNTERAQTVDLVRYLLSYASNPFSSVKSNPSNGEFLESSVRKVLNELAQLTHAQETNLSGSVQNQFPDRYGQAPRPLGAPQTNLFGSVQNQFSDRYGQAPRSPGKNVEMKRGDWICPRCSFMNFARNMKCLECEEARPKRQLTGGEWECPQCDFFNYGRNTVCLRCDCRRPGEVSLGANETAVDSRLAANEEKAQRWFSKISQLDTNSDMSSAVEDEDFPEIMPLRKGVNRFVVSRRKTPLERRLANAQYSRNLGNDATSESSSPTMNPNLRLQNAGVNTASSASNSASQHVAPRGSDYVPFVPLPADMFAKKTDQSNIDEMDKSLHSMIDEQKGASDSWQPPEKPLSTEREKEEAEKSERWFKRVAELHNDTDLSGSISDEDFPEIMPMRKGENRFVVSKRKDRSLTSPMYKRRAAMEQAKDTNFVPFVPFPPNYFAQKDNQQLDKADSTDKPYITGENSTQTVVDQQPRSRNSGSSDYSRSDKFTERPNTAGNSPKNFTETSRSGNDVSSGTTSENQKVGDRWSGKSLEGSAVKEPDPLDMSEEAKAERWFRRVAQIKDISELSQIPDEDFPSIMPMRKGVNRFVVSKRKTPLERRLTSTQYRRNLPIVSSDPAKESDDS